MNTGAALLRAIACQQEVRLRERLREPVDFCPVHGRLVTARAGKLLGRCDRCVQEAAEVYRQWAES